MAETITIATIKVVIDSETSYENIGDVDGGFSHSALEHHIKRFGHQKLLDKLSYMQHQLWAVKEAIEKKQRLKSQQPVPVAIWNPNNKK